MSTKGVEHVGVQYKTWRRLTQSAKDDNNDDDGGDGGDGDGECRVCMWCSAGRCNGVDRCCPS